MGINTSLLSDNIVLVRGADETLSLEFLDEDNIPIDITGDIIYLVAKRFLEDSDEDIVLNISQATHLSPTEGKTQIAIPSSSITSIEPNQYVYEIIRQTQSEGIKRARYGILIIIDNVKNLFV